ncbi:MAG: hypothetical protein KDB54_02145 [Solirubrobacterales bacterium]|nr:hypothetical protein [Solirubrobacterales bacterium]HRV60612.1 hypothetical protein [Solirubrobacterales bacterium]
MLRSPLTSDGLRAARILTFLTAVALLVTLAFASHSEAKSTKRISLGARNLATLAPNCGRDFSRDCTVEGKLTAFQSLTSRYPGRNFVVPFNGKLVTWSISLANPTRGDIDNNPAQLPAFNTIFGAPAQAGISILRQVEKRKKGGPRFKLVRKSPIEILNPYFGTTVTFALENPLNVYEGNVVALTIPTWAPALWSPRVCNGTIYGDLDPGKCDQARERYTWRGSRVSRGDPATCELSNDGGPNEQLQKTAPQTRIESVRRYGCYYGGNVLLYSALIVGR